MLWVGIAFAYVLVAMIFVGILIGYLEDGDYAVWRIVVVAALWPLSLLLGLGGAIGKELRSIRDLEKKL